MFFNSIIYLEKHIFLTDWISGKTCHTAADPNVLALLRCDGMQVSQYSSLWLINLASMSESANPESNDTNQNPKMQIRLNLTCQMLLFLPNV